MELKTPTKKGFKTPRYRPPLPMLIEPCSGTCVDEYDWPLFSGYYNGMSVIVDDSQAMTLLTNKGFFGKGSLSKGCPNLAKRKIPISVVYESQWKRRKMWMESLNNLLKNKKKSDETSQDKMVVDDNDKSNDVEKKGVDKENNSPQENNSGKTEQKPSETCEAEANEDNKVPLDIETVTKPAIEEPEGDRMEICDSDKKEIINNSVQIEEPSKDNVQSDNNSGETEEEVTPSKVSNDQSECVGKVNSSNNILNDQSECVGKINLSNNKEKGTLNINEVLVIPDIDGDLEQYFLNLKPYIEDEKIKTAIEVLYLSLEEAFFLSYACNCLQIFDLTSNILRIRDMWVLFQEAQPDFIEKYIAYHYFRAKGWVVKSGTKFGGDFLLYKKGPLYFHASYIVIVEVLKNGENARNRITWQKIIGMNRMAESANKEILICHVLWPDVEKEKFNNPGILKEFGVSETLLRRWQATHEKTPQLDKILVL